MKNKKLIGMGIAVVLVVGVGVSFLIPRGTDSNPVESQVVESTEVAEPSSYVDDILNNSSTVSTNETEQTVESVEATASSEAEVIKETEATESTEMLETTESSDTSEVTEIAEGSNPSEPTESADKTTSSGTDSGFVMGNAEFSEFLDGSGVTLSSDAEVQNAYHYHVGNTVKENCKYVFVVNDQYYNMKYTEKEWDGFLIQDLVADVAYSTIEEAIASADSAPTYVSMYLPLSYCGAQTVDEYNGMLDSIYLVVIDGDEVNKVALN